MVFASSAPHIVVQDVVVPPSATQLVQQRHAVSAAQALTAGQHIVFVHFVQAESLDVGVQRTPPELDEEVVTPLHGAAHLAATQLLRAWVAVSGWGHCIRQRL
jgi:hypothetical protein